MQHDALHTTDLYWKMGYYVIIEQHSLCKEMSLLQNVYFCYSSYKIVCYNV